MTPKIRILMNVSILLNREQFLRNMDDQGDFSTVGFIMFYYSIKHFLKWLMINIYYDVN